MQEVSVSASRDVEAEEPEEQSYNRLGSESITKLLFEFATPAFAGILIQALYNIIDAIYLGHGVGEIALAATTISFPSMIVLMTLATLIGTGGSSLASIKLGEKNHADAEKILAHCLVLCLICYFVLLGASYFFLDEFLILSGASAEVLPHAHDFISVIVYASLFELVGFGLMGFIRTAGFPKFALMSQMIGIATNIVLGFLFIIVFKWGMLGAGAATACAFTVSSVSVLAFFFSRKNPLKLRLKYCQLEKKLVTRILALGTPAALMQLGGAFFSIVENGFLNYYGQRDEVLGAEGALAVMGILGRIGFITVTPGIALSQGAQPIVGFNYGSKQYDRVIETFLKATLFSVIGLTVFWLVALIFPKELLHFFGLKEEYMDYAALSVRLYLLLLPLIAVTMIGSGFFQATGQARKSIILGVLRQFLFLIPALCVVPLFAPQIFGITELQALYFSTTWSDALSVIVVGGCMVFEIRRLKKLMATESTSEAEAQQ